MALGGGVIYATTFGGIYRSTDGGGIWTLRGTPPPPYSVVMDTLVVDPVTPTTLYGSRGGPAAGVFKSLDGGASWARSGSGLPQHVFAILAIDPRHPSRLFAGTGQGLSQGIYLSTDAGASWSLALSGIANVAAVVIDPTNSNRIYAIGDTPTLRTAVVFSADGGRTWATGNGLPDTGGRTSLAVDPGEPSDVYASDYCCALIRKSTDYGANWTSMRHPLTDIETLVVDPRAAGVLYAGGGATWSDFNSGFPPFPAVRQLLADPGGRFLLALNYDMRLYSYSFSPQELGIPALSPRGMIAFAALLAICAVWISVAG